MPDVRIRRVQVAAKGSTGTQDITISGFGTPVAAIFIMSGATANNTATAHAHLSIGFTDGVTSKMGCVTSADAVASSDSATNCGAAVIRTLPDTPAASNPDRAGFSSWITDGVRIDWTVSSGTAFLIDVILFGGADIANVDVDTVALGTGTSAINVTAPGFQADLVFALCVGQADEGYGAHARMSFGAYDRVNATQGCAAYIDIDAQATMSTAGRVSTTYAAMAFTSLAALSYGLTLGSHASGFTVTPSASAGSDNMVYLAIKWNTTVGTALFTETLPGTASTAYNKTGLSFAPGFGISVGATVGAAVDATDGADAEGFSISSFDRLSLGTAAIGQNDGAADSDTSSYKTESYLLEYTGASNGYAQAWSSFGGFTADGWNKTQVGANSADAYKNFSIAIQTAGSVPLFMHHRQMQGMS